MAEQLWDLPSPLVSQNRQPYAVTRHVNPFLYCLQYAKRLRGYKIVFMRLNSELVNVKIMGQGVD